MATHHTKTALTPAREICLRTISFVGSSVKDPDPSKSRSRFPWRLDGWPEFDEVIDDSDWHVLETPPTHRHL
jgi:hypothetical protein